MAVADHRDAGSAITFGFDEAGIVDRAGDRRANEAGNSQAERYTDREVALGCDVPAVEDVDIVCVGKEPAASSIDSNSTGAVRVDVSEVVDLHLIPCAQHSETIVAGNLDDAVIGEVSISKLGDHPGTIVAGDREP